ncbi:MAG: hypothetical protein JXX29_07580 [Deltaproteobacteria bacterium]|nr:hypothetical protein [Deltaproteobacteria bacterium]MBN2671517.1 hypothetical protein [Deltaproteobacteria bacterium]
MNSVGTDTWERFAAQNRFTPPSVPSRAGEHNIDSILHPATEDDVERIELLSLLYLEL